MSAAPPSSIPWFVSYNDVDREKAREVARFLQSHGIATFFDRAGLAAGEPWFDGLEAALRSSRGALVLLSSAGLGPIQKRELQFAQLRQARLEQTPGAPPFRVVPVILRRDPPDEIPGFAVLNTSVEIDDPSQPVELLDALRGEPAAGGRPFRHERCPFRALNAFREEDAPLYFGRLEEAAALHELVTAQTFVAVVGPSGSGKSSLVQAGLLPRLRAGRPPLPAWDAITFTPGRRPFYDAALALSGLWLTARGDVPARVAQADDMETRLLDGRSQFASYVAEAVRRIPHTDRLLIVVDQFEELFTYPHDAGMRRSFVDSLFACAGESFCQVVITVRADYYGRTLESGAALAGVMRQAQLSVAAMEADDLREVIDGPSSRVGLAFEPGLVDRILDDVARQPGSLPLLEFTLTELWNLARDGLVTHQHYEQIGGVARAIGTRADGVLAALGETRRQKARAVLTRMVRVSPSDEEGANTRQALPLGELDDEGRAIVDEFARARLVVSGRTEKGEAVAEVAHEALIRGWRTLSRWIAEEFQFLVWRQQLDASVSGWVRSQEDAAWLLSGSRLREAREWQRSHPGGFTAREQRFLDASVRQEAGSRAWRWAAAVVVVLAAAAAAAYSLWRQTDSYVVHAAIRDAPVRDAAFAGRSDEDPYIETIQDWIAALVTTGRIDEAREAIDQIGLVTECAAATAAAHHRVVDERPTAAVLPEITALLQQPDGHALVCASRLPLSAMERDAVRRAARTHLQPAPPSASPDTNYSTLRDALLAADAMQRLGAIGEAQALAKAALSGVLASASTAKNSLLAAIASRVGGQLSNDDRRRLLAGFPADDEYYARVAQASLRALDATADGVEAFLKGLAGSGPPWGPDGDPLDVVFDTAIAHQAGLLLAREVRAGKEDAATRAVNQLTTRLRRDESGARSLAVLVIPVSEALVERGRQASALILVEPLLPRLESIANEDDRSRAASGLARVYAACGRLAQAKSLADRARRALDRLGGYAAIVLHAG